MQAPPIKYLLVVVSVSVNVTSCIKRSTPVTSNSEEVHFQVVCR